VTTVLNSNVKKPEVIPSGFQFPLQQESKEHCEMTQCKNGN